MTAEEKQLHNNSLSLVVWKFFNFPATMQGPSKVRPLSLTMTAAELLLWQLYGNLSVCKGLLTWVHSAWQTWQWQLYMNLPVCKARLRWVRPGWQSGQWQLQSTHSYHAVTAVWNSPVCKDRLRWVRWAWQSWPCRPAGRSGDSFQSASGGRGGCAGPAGESGAQSCTGGCWPACNTRTQLGVGQARRGQGQVFRVAGYNFFLNKSYEKMMAPEEIFRQLSLWMVNFCPLPHIYAIFTCVNPDP